MKEQDFYELKIGQFIYCEGESVEITMMEKSKVGNAIEFNNNISIFNLSNRDYLKWKDICKVCSLTPPKKKKKVVCECWKCNDCELRWYVKGYKWLNANKVERIPEIDKTVEVEE